MPSFRLAGSFKVASPMALFATASVLALTQIASAADVPVKAPRWIPPPVHNWTGFYIGGNAGYGWGNANDAMVLGGGWLADGAGDNVPLTPLGNGRTRAERLHWRYSGRL